MYNKVSMNLKKVLFLTSILIFVFFALLLKFYFKENLQRIEYQLVPFPVLEKKEPTIKLPLRRLTQSKQIDEMIYERISATVAPNFLSEVLNEVELVNLIHITKKEKQFAIECEFGPLYNTSNLELFCPEELISFGRIKECSLRVAELIDEIAKAPKRDCRLPLLNPIPENLNDYYLVTLASRVKVFTPEIAKWFSENRPECKDKFFELVGKEIAYPIVVWILDVKEKIVYP